jgi:F-type H+-transporting ATPase subunit delta
MKQSRASIRYAKAFLQVADKQNSLDSAAADMQKVVSITAESKDLVRALENPMASTSVKKAIFDDVCEGASDITIDFVRVIS